MSETTDRVWSYLLKKSAAKSVRIHELEAELVEPNKKMIAALKDIRTWAACGRAMGFHEKDEALDDIVKLCDKTLKPKGASDE